MSAAGTANDNKSSGIMRFAVSGKGLLAIASVALVLISMALQWQHLSPHIHAGESTLTSENAVRFRYAKLIAMGQKVPLVDKRVMWPE
ncbi:MAG TPA: hypothetical protein VLA51_09175, partial [Paracoccaceae bacterium]|nr:hypothetical protein [Paracoccaceae bacterium]